MAKSASTKKHKSLKLWHTKADET